MIYELLEEGTPSGLSDLVNKRIEAGYLPLGTPFIGNPLPSRSTY